MKKFIASLLFLLPWMTSWGQEVNVVVDRMQFENRMGREPATAADKYSGIEGTPFLSKEFVKGSLITNDSIMYKDIPLRYNIFSDEMEFLLIDDPVPREISNPRNFRYFNVGNRTFIYTAYRSNRSPRQGYMEIITDGKCQLLLKRRTDYADPEGARGFTPAKPARFVEKMDTYYLRFDKKVPEEVRFRRRGILPLFGDMQDEIADFVNETGLSYRSREDLIDIVRYYNQLAGQEETGNLQ